MQLSLESTSEEESEASEDEEEEVNPFQTLMKSVLPGDSSDDEVETSGEQGFPTRESDASDSEQELRGITTEAEDKADADGSLEASAADSHDIEPAHVLTSGESDQEDLQTTDSFRLDTSTDGSSRAMGHFHRYNWPLETDEALDEFRQMAETLASRKPVFGAAKKSRTLGSLVCDPGLKGPEFRAKTEPVTVGLLRPKLRGSVGAKDPSAEDTPAALSPTESEFLGQLDTYRDILISDVSLDSLPEFRKAYLLHTLNHVLKTRSIVMHNNTKIKMSEETGKELTVDPKDQGFTRPKVSSPYPMVNLSRTYSL